MQTETGKVNKKILYGMAFLIPAVMMITVYSILGIFPFGNRSILVSDLGNQFVDYYSYFKSVITGNNDFTYTFSKNLGGDMVGFSAYYLQNPVLFLLLLFPGKWMSVGIMLVILIQISLSGLSFCFYLNHIEEPRYGSLLFSTSYAFMGFFFSYISLPIYFSNLALLPMVILGIHKIIKNSKDRIWYVLSLAIYIFMNYYLGFMLCIFSMIFFIYLLLREAGSLSRLIQYKKTIRSFLLSSLLAAGLVLSDLAMILLSLKGQKDTPSLSNLSFYRQFKMLDVFSKLYSNSSKNHELPIIYCGLLAVVFALLYFMCKKYSRREKILSVGVIFSILICFYIHTFDVIWHGFNEPVGFAFRYAYVFSFLILFIGYRGFIACDYKVEKKTIFITGAIILIYTAYLTITRNVYVDRKTAIYNLIIIMLICVSLWIFQKNIHQGKKILFCILAMITFSDLSFNAVQAVRYYPEEKATDYNDYVDRVAPVIEDIKAGDTGFYRLEKDFERTHNDSMQFDYAGLTHSSSCEKDYVKAFIAKMGFRNYGLWAYYNEGGTTFADCFLGVKYLVSRFDSTDKPYEKMKEINDLYLYKNNYALPIGFCTTDAMLKVDMENTNLFEIQNDIATGLDNDSEDIYERAEVSNVKIENLRKEQEKDCIRYVKEDTGKEAFIEYKITAVNNRGIFLYFNAPQMQGAELRINDSSYGDYFTNSVWNMVYIGKYTKGEEISVKLYAKGDELRISDSLFYYENQEVLKNRMEKIRSGGADLVKITSSHLKGSVTVPENSTHIMFSIPYEKDWKIEIDGKKAETKEVLGALMAVEAKPGRHTIEMRYIPKGFTQTIWISLTCLVILMFLIKNARMKDTEK